MVDQVAETPEQKVNREALQEAVRNNNFKRVTELLMSRQITNDQGQHGTKLEHAKDYEQNEHGENVFHIAAEYATPEIIQALVDGRKKHDGTALSAKNLLNQKTTETACTPLHKSANAGKPENAKKLIELGADESICDAQNMTYKQVALKSDSGHDEKTKAAFFGFSEEDFTQANFILSNLGQDRDFWFRDFHGNKTQFLNTFSNAPITLFNVTNLCKEGGDETVANYMSHTQTLQAANDKAQESSEGQLRITSGTNNTSYHASTVFGFTNQGTSKSSLTTRQLLGITLTLTFAAVAFAAIAIQVDKEIGKAVDWKNFFNIFGKGANKDIFGTAVGAGIGAGLIFSSIAKRDQIKGVVSPGGKGDNREQSAMYNGI